MHVVTHAQNDAHVLYFHLKIPLLRVINAYALADDLDTVIFRFVIAIDDEMYAFICQTQLLQWRRLFLSQCLRTHQYIFGLLRVPQQL